MLSFIADFISLSSTTLFPLFAAYKALKTPTPATLAPWLTFYATLSVINLLENTVAYPLTYLPLYSWVRMFGYLYLLMPAPQGATKVYTTYIEPYLINYETEIEDFISNSHEHLKTMGLQYFKQAINWFRVHVLNEQPRPATPPGPSAQTYAQSLLSRFYSTATTGATVPGSGPAGNDFYSSVLGALQTATGGLNVNAVSRAAHMGSSGALVPPELATPADRLNYIRQARLGLSALMQAYDREETDLAEEKSTGLSKSRSETEFDKIERSEASPDRSGKPPNVQRQSSGWMPWNWNKEDQAAAAKKDKFEEEPAHDVPAEAKSSGLDRGFGN
ncbi:hypothetical protein BT63DRAFT_155975 [Microthyrium microscopicum]|uniref:Protein YOP1 n=1 Tax=Microthyrium microscopicum TaxID=703497 RepID=A0A6A6UMF6_9PEZI|nr:hypothetical protein BT63DRAFT_155975 [Microthyrium microscopicum]